MKNIFAKVAILASLFAPLAASAKTTTPVLSVPAATEMTQTFVPGSLISGSYSASSSFATLTESTTDNKTFLFTLTANNLNTLFTDGAFIGSIAVVTTTNVTKNDVSVGSVSGGVSAIAVSNGSGPNGNYDFRYDISQGQDRLTAAETVTWSSTFSQAVTINSFALHVQGLTNQQGGSAWYGASAVPSVPEPETYAMLVAGLGLMGFVARRRAKKAA